jgi:hypothetical protein
MTNDPELLHDCARATAAAVIEQLNLREEEIPDALDCFTVVIEEGMKYLLWRSEVAPPVIRESLN